MAGRTLNRPQKSMSARSLGALDVRAGRELVDRPICASPRLATCVARCRERRAIAMNSEPVSLSRPPQNISITG